MAVKISIKSSGPSSAAMFQFIQFTASSLKIDYKWMLSTGILTSSEMEWIEQDQGVPV